MWKQKCALGAVLLGILAFSAGCGVRQIRDEVTVEAGQELEFMGEDFFEASGRELEKIVFDISRVDADRPGIYPAEALVGRKRYGITVYVADRTPPMVELAGRVVFTDNLAEYDPKELIEAVYDVSDYTVSFTRFAWEAELEEYGDPGWESLEALMLAPLSQEQLRSLGTEKVPGKPGIYRGVLAVADIYDNVWLEQLWIVLEPGEMEAALAAGTAAGEAAGTLAVGSVAANTASLQPESSPVGETASRTESPAAEAAGNGGSGPVSPSAADPDYYDTHLEEGQLAAVNAGYYQVVEDPRYGGYIVMVHGGEGSYGTQLIQAYLASIGCEAVGGSGDWISMDADQYAVYVTAKEIRPVEEGMESDWGELLWKQQASREG